ncbi:MAG: FtsX-like permease family protein, partial [Lysobacterales bacterium]
RADNRVTAGSFWRSAASVSEPVRPQFSVEEDFAARLGWQLGDRIAFDVAGQRLEAPITSLRSVDWQSFQPNFFVLAPPAALDGFAASYITALKVPVRDARFTADLVARFPNVSVIDVDQVLGQVRATADQVSTVVEVVFYFALAAGVLVLLAAISASQDERLLEGAVMRALGASRRQLRLAQASEFATIGLLAGLTAALAASALAGVIATRVFDLEWQADWRLVATGAVLGIIGVVGAGLIATRRIVHASPMATLRDLQA